MLSKALSSIPGNVACTVITVVCLHMNQKVHVDCNVKYPVEIEGFLKFTGSHIHCKCGSSSEMVQGRHVFTTDY